jgi:hypothetical protein
MKTFGEIGLLCFRPGTASGLGRGRRYWVSRWIAQGQQDSFRAVCLSPEFGQGLAKGFHPKIFFALAAVHTIHESSQIDEFAAGVHEVEIKDLLTSHNIQRYSLRLAAPV